jgi:hypothetical protein
LTVIHAHRKLLKFFLAGIRWKMDLIRERETVRRHRAEIQRASPVADEFAASAYLIIPGVTTILRSRIEHTKIAGSRVDFDCH